MIDADSFCSEAQLQSPQCFMCGSRFFSIERGVMKEDGRVCCARCLTYLGRTEDLLFALGECGPAIGLRH